MHLKFYRTWKHTLKKHYKATGVVLLLLVVAGGLWYAGRFYSIRISLVTNPAYPKTVPTPGAAAVSADSLAAYARQIVAKCASASYRPGCYETEVPKLMDTISMQDAFKVTELVQQDDPSYQYCHVLGHKLAERETAKDPSKWKDVVTMCPDGVCSNGCVHGAFQQRFSAEWVTPAELEAIKPELLDVCEKRTGWNPTPLEQATCYHAMGHMLMYATNGDITTSVKLCDELAVKDNGQRDYRKLCYDGSFMQIFQPLEPDDFSLVKGKQPSKAQLASYCDKFSALSKVSCWSEGWPLYRDEILTPRGVVAFCTHLKNVTDQNTCYTDQFYVVTAQEQFDTGFMQRYCSQLPAGVSGRCFANTASRLIETDYKNIDKSVAVCKSAPAGDDQTQCYQELLLYSTYNFHAGSAEFYQICNAMDEPWKGQCLARS